MHSRYGKVVDSVGETMIVKKEAISHDQPLLFSNLLNINLLVYLLVKTDSIASVKLIKIVFLFYSVRKLQYRI